MIIFIAAPTTSTSNRAATTSSSPVLTQTQVHYSDAGLDYGGVYAHTTEFGEGNHKGTKAATIRFVKYYKGVYNPMFPL